MIATSMIAWLSDLLIHSIWMGAAAAVLAWLGFHASRQPSIRHAIALSAFSLLGIGLLFAAIQSWPKHSQIPNLVWTSASPSAVPAARSTTPASGIVEAPSTSAALPAASPASWRTALVIAWLVGTAGMVLRHGHGWWLVIRLRQRSRAASDSLTALVTALAMRMGVPPPLLRLHDHLEVPTVIGWWRPAILLPASLATGLPTNQLESLILHELAHLRRRDWIIELGVSLMQTALFFHPAVHWLARRLRAERERCCDAMALDAGADAQSFAQALLALVEQVPVPPPALAASGGVLTERIRAILGMPRSADGAMRALVLILILPGVLLLAVACSRDSRSENHLAPPLSTTQLPAPPPRPVFSLEQRIRARASPTQVMWSVQTVEGSPAVFAKLGLPTSGPARLYDGQEKVAIEQAIERSPDDFDFETINRPHITAYPLQTAHLAVLQEYAYLNDYSFLPDGKLDPMISLVNYGHIVEVCGEASAADASGRRHLVVSWLKAESLKPLANYVFSFSHNDPEQAKNSTFKWEESLGSQYRGIHTGPTNLASDGLLVIPAIHSLWYQSSPVRKRISSFTGPDITKDAEAKHASGSLARAYLVTGEIIDVPQDTFIRGDTGRVAWLESSVTFTVHDEPLPAVVARLRSAVSIPISFDPDPEHATLRVSVSADREPLRTVLPRLLSQTLLVARVQAEGLSLEREDISDYPATELGSVDTAPTTPARLYFDGKNEDLIKAARAEQEKLKEEERLRREALKAPATELGDDKTLAANNQKPLEVPEVTVVAAAVATGDEGKADVLFAKGRDIYNQALNAGNTPQRDDLYKQSVQELSTAMAIYSELVEKNPNDTSLVNKLKECQRLRYGAMKQLRF